MYNDIQLITNIYGYGLTLVITMGFFELHTLRGAPIPPPGHKLVNGRLYKYLGHKVWKEVN